MVESGKISPEEALELLQALSAGDEAHEEQDLPDELPAQVEAPSESKAVQGEVLTPDPGLSQAPNFDRWRGFWLWPFWAGTAILILGAVLVYFTQIRNGNPLWLFCAGMPFILGLIVMLIAWSSRNSRWLHLRIRQAPGESPQSLAISFPLFFLGPISSLLRWTRGRVSGLDTTSLDEVLIALDGAQGDGPIYIEVNDEEDGEAVQIYIG